MQGDDLTKKTLVLILGGGQGERLYPLTRDRSKPAVPFGGIYRIIDFTLSNCLNSGLRRIYVLTQYKSISLDRHFRQAWHCFNEELGEYIVAVPPQQRMGERWYLGTADAIYQNVYTLQQERPGLVLILAGDHVYKMNYLGMLASHIETKAEITVACVEVPLSQGNRFGVVSVDERNRIRAFNEKPQDPQPLPHRPGMCLASMGIYAFSTETLVQLVSEDARRDTTHDFGSDIIPRVVHERPVYAYPFRGENQGKTPYWRDIGALDAYWRAHMDLLGREPVFRLDDEAWPTRAYQQQCPPTRFLSLEDGAPAVAVDSIICQGCLIEAGKMERSVLSPKVHIRRGAEVTECILMDDVVVGAGSRLRRTIVDKQVIVPRNAQVGFDLDQDRRKFTVTDSGIVVIPKGLPLDEEFWRS